MFCIAWSETLKGTVAKVLQDINCLIIYLFMGVQQSMGGCAGLSTQELGVEIAAKKEGFFKSSVPLDL